jgi:hypothetical protein
MNMLRGAREFGRDIRREISIRANSNTYSQYGEDQQIMQCFKESEGFYFDIGCSLPRKFSNSFLFYEKGWIGIGVDLNSRMKYFWRILRRRDSFLVAGISNLITIDWFIMEHGFSSTVSEAYAQSLVVNRSRKIIKKGKFKAVKLSALCESHFECIKPSDACFFNIDAESHDMNILESNDWNRFVPRVICIEDPDAQRTPETEINRFLSRRGYKFLTQSGPSSIYVHRAYSP